MSAKVTAHAAAILALVAGSAMAGDCCKDKQTTPTAAMPGSGLVINLDEHGNRIQAQPKGLPAAAAKSNAGLVVENNPAGGIKIDLKGRFQTAVMATKGADGEVNVSCEPAPQAGAK